MKNPTFPAPAAAPPQTPAEAPSANGESPRDGGGSEVLTSLLRSAPFASHRAREVQPLGGCLIGVCTEDRHATLVGRVRVQWNTAHGAFDCWLPTLRNLPVRCADQVLLLQPDNGAEAVVVGVLDGFTRRDTPPDRVAARLELQADEVVRLEDTRGRPILELRAGESGPIVRLVSEGVSLEVDGKLAFRADSIRMEARQGTLELEASDDVTIKGEVVHLN